MQRQDHAHAAHKGPHREMRAGEIQRLQTGANDRFLQCRQGLPPDELPSCQRFIENSLPASGVAIRRPDVSMNIAFRSSPPTAPDDAEPLGSGSVARIEIFDELPAGEAAWRKLVTLGAVASPYQNYDW